MSNPPSAKLATDFDEAILDLKNRLQIKRDESQYLSQAFRLPDEVLSSALGDVDEIAEKGRHQFEQALLGISRYRGPSNHIGSFDPFYGSDLNTVVTFLFADQIKAAVISKCADGALWPRPGISQTERVARLAQTEAEIKALEDELNALFQEIASLNRHLVGLTPNIHTAG